MDSDVPSHALTFGGVALRGKDICLGRTSGGLACTFFATAEGQYTRYALRYFIFTSPLDLATRTISARRDS